MVRFFAHKLCASAFFIEGLLFSVCPGLHGLETLSNTKTKTACGNFRGLLEKHVMMVSSHICLIYGKEGRLTHERQKSAVLFVSERSCY